MIFQNSSRVEIVIHNVFYSSLSATTITVYRGEDPSLIDYISAGALAGGAYKLNLGLAATFVGAGLGIGIDFFFLNLSLLF